MKTLEDYERWLQNSQLGIGSTLDERELNEALQLVLDYLGLRPERLHEQLEVTYPRRRAKSH